MTDSAARRPRPVELVVRILVVAALAVDAYVHLHLASRYQLAQPTGIGQGNLFRAEGAVAVVVGLYLLVRGTRPAYLVAALALLGGAALVVLYRYVDVPAVGPIPTMYEPLWFGEKTFSAVAEAAGGVLALVGLALARRSGAHRT